MRSREDSRAVRAQSSSARPGPGKRCSACSLSGPVCRLERQSRGIFYDRSWPYMRSYFASCGWARRAAGSFRTAIRSPFPRVRLPRSAHNVIRFRIGERNGVPCRMLRIERMERVQHPLDWLPFEIHRLGHAGFVTRHRPHGSPQKTLREGLRQAASYGILPRRAALMARVRRTCWDVVQW